MILKWKGSFAVQFSRQADEKDLASLQSARERKAGSFLLCLLRTTIPVAQSLRTNAKGKFEKRKSAKKIKRGMAGRAIR